MPILKVHQLSIHIGEQILVQPLSFDIGAGQTLAVVGESGSGKSLTAKAIMRLLDPHVFQTSGHIRFYNANNPLDLMSLSEKALCQLRGQDVTMVFQEPMSALNPVQTIGQQLREVIQLHQKGLAKSQQTQQVMQLLTSVGLGHIPSIYQRYPHELSGGQKQRVVIAMAIANKTKLLIADEPTTALDVTVQHEIMALLKQLQNDYQFGLLFITHDLALASHIATHVMVMHQGQKVEYGMAQQVFNQPQVAYTKALLGARIDASSKGFELATVQTLLNGQYQRTAIRPVPASEQTVLTVTHLRVYYQQSKSLFTKRQIPIVQDVHFKIKKGVVFGIVGESGSGKSTIAKVICGLHHLYDGTILFNGKPFEQLKKQKLLPSYVQMIFQDPMSSLNPSMRISNILLEALKQQKQAGNLKQRVLDLLRDVGLTEAYYNRYPHELSGGQKQRIGIARALAMNPQLLIADESVSALDVSVQAQILNLLNQLKHKYQLSILFISHDLNIVHYFCDEVLVLQKGRTVEQGQVADIMECPTHAYTKQLLAATPQFKKGAVTL